MITSPMEPTKSPEFLIASGMAKIPVPILPLSKWIMASRLLKLAVLINVFLQFACLLVRQRSYEILWPPSSAGWGWALTSTSQSSSEEGIGTLEAFSKLTLGLWSWAFSHSLEKRNVLTIQMQNERHWLLLLDRLQNGKDVLPPHFRVEQKLTQLFEIKARQENSHFLSENYRYLTPDPKSYLLIT